MHFSVATLRNKRRFEPRFTSFYERRDFFLSLDTTLQSAATLRITRGTPASSERGASQYQGMNPACFRAFQWHTGKLPPLTHKTVQKMPPRGSLSHRPITEPILINRIANKRLQVWLITDFLFFKKSSNMRIRTALKICARLHLWSQILFYPVLSTSIKLIYKNQVNQSHYRPEVPSGFQKVKVPRLRDNDPNGGKV